VSANSRANVNKVSQNRYVVPQKRNQARDLTLHPTITSKKKTKQIKTLIDSGCTHTCISSDLVKAENIPTKPIAQPFRVINADGSESGGKTITEYVELEMDTGGHKEELEAVVTKLESSDMFLGHDWLVKHNPEIDWKKGIVQFTRCPPDCTTPHQNITVQPRNRQLRSSEISQEDEEMEKEPDPTNPEDLPEYMRPFTHLFNKRNFDKLPERTEWDHEINLLPDAPKELKAKVYPMTQKENEELKAFIKENLETGRIRPSKSPYASPCFFIPKKDGSKRLVQDYRKLNSYTIKDKTPLPLISEVLDKLKDAKVFNKFDFIWGYNNVRVKEGDEHKAAFLTNEGLFEPTVMFFGLCNSPGTFSRMMTSIFRDLLHEGVLVNYMDDFAVPGKDDKDLEEKTVKFLKVAEKHGLHFKRSKCIFHAPEIPMLGTVVGNGKARMEPEKVAAVRDWKTPTNIKGVESFLGFVNFYRRFIKDFSKIAAPLNKLKGKGEWEWGKDQQEAFDTLKQRVTEEPVLALPRDEGQFRVETDASGYAIGGVLSQQQDGKWKPIAFLSRTMTPAERNYEIYDKELLAIMEALRVWRQYLLDAKERFEIWTDHENLKYFREPHKLNGRQARWYLKLQDYDFIIRHVPGKTNTKADILSRMMGYDGKDDNRDTIVLKEEMFVRTMDMKEEWEEILLRAERFEVTADMDIMEDIRRCTSRETEFLKHLKEKPDVAWERDGVAYFQGRIYVPNRKDLRDRILKEHHDPPDIGHPGQHRMLEMVKRTFWWPSLRKDVKRYVKGCDSCQRNKIQHQVKAAPLHPLLTPQYPWEEISIDMIGPLPMSQGYDAILVVVDRFSKMIRLIPTNVTLSSSQLAHIYRDEIWKLHGIPKRIISDRGPQFASMFMKGLCKAIGIERNLSTAYHPQTDGQTERINQEVEAFLRGYINYAQDDWKEWLAMAEFQYNDKEHSATKQTPFYLNYGRHPWKGNIIMTSDVPAVTDFIKKLAEVREEARAALEDNRERMEEQVNRKRRQSREYKRGDKVWLEGSNITSNRPSQKLDHRRYGPFPIKEKVGKGAYRLELPEGWVIHDVFNEALLTPHHGPEFDIQQAPLPPPPEIINGEEEWEVEEIRDHRRRGNGMQYLVHWKGYPDEEDRWIAKSNLGNAQELLEEYHQKIERQERERDKQVTRTKPIKRGGKSRK
jgi:transposase InsO family protein